MRIFPELTGLWRNRDFVRLWVGITLSQLGSGLGALGLVAVVMLEASPLQMGVLSGAGVAPGVMFGLGIGVWADRMRLRPILVITSIVRALSLASVPAAFALDVLLMEQLYGVALINGVCRTFTSVSFGAYLPKVVGRGNLVEANSKLAASGSVVETSAFSVGGWIAQLASAVATVITEALSFVLSALFFLAIRIPESEVSSEDEHRSTLPEVWEGLAFVFANPVLRALAGSAVAEGLLHGGVLRRHPHLWGAGVGARHGCPGDHIRRGWYQLIDRCNVLYKSRPTIWRGPRDCCRVAVVRHWNPPARAGPRTSCNCRGGLGHLATLRCSVYHLWHKRSESATGGDSGWNVGSCDCHLPIRRHWGFSGGVALGRGAGRDSRLETDAGGCWRMRSRRSGMAIPLTGVEAEGNYA